MNFIDRQIIDVKLPFNLTKRYKSLFYPAKFDLHQTNVLRLQNLDVTNDGLCFQKGKLIKGCVQSYEHKIPIFERSGFIQLRKNQTQELSSNYQHLFIHHPWSSNYYHWFTEAIPRIWKVKSELDSLVLVIPEHLMNLTFVKESISTFKFKEIIQVPGNLNLRVPNAVVPEIKPTCFSYDPHVATEIARHFNQFADLKKTELSMPIEFAYIIRGKNSKREIVNEDAVIKKLNEYKITSIDARNYSLIDQVNISKKLKLLISNGSGLTNMIFMDRHSAVLELHKQLTNMNDFHDKVLWHLASVLDLTYFHQECEPERRGADMYSANLKVNISLLEKNVVKCLELLNQ